MDLCGVPATDLGAAVEEDFQETDDARVMDLDARITDRADGNRQGEALQQREVDVHVEPLRLETSEAVDDGLEPLADRVEVVQSFPELKIRKIMGGYLVAQEDGEFFVLLENRVLEVGAEDMVTMFDRSQSRACRSSCG